MFPDDRPVRFIQDLDCKRKQDGLFEKRDPLDIRQQRFDHGIGEFREVMRGKRIVSELESEVLQPLADFIVRGPEDAARAIETMAFEPGKQQELLPAIVVVNLGEFFEDSFGLSEGFD